MGSHRARLVLLLITCSCGHSQVDKDRAHNRCMAMPQNAAEVAWRLLPGQYTIDGGSTPPMPDVDFPLDDEAAFAATFPEHAGQVNFSRERIEVVRGFAGTEPAWVAIVDDELIAKFAKYPWCKGAAPETFGRLLVVPKGAPAFAESTCHTGRCTGGPYP